VPPLEDADAATPTSLRERMEAHRANPVCATCHRPMDPLGFALEHFDAIGRWRDTDGGAAIDAAIELQGTPIDSLPAFRETLAEVGDRRFVKTVVEKLMTYALGRGVQYYDAPLIRRIVGQLERDGDRWSSLVQQIVASPPFQRQRMPETDGAETVADAAP